MNPKIQHIKPKFSPTVMEWFYFVLKIVGFLGISYSFSEYSDFYEKNKIFYNIASGINTFLIANVLISIGRFLIISFYERKSQNSTRVRGNVILGINQFSGILNTIFVIIAIMIILNINPKEFLTSITLVAMAIALLFKDYITNMISGLIIMFSDQFTVGDFIIIGEHQGRITDITLSNIVIKNEDDDIVLIPNNAAFNLNIVNRTLENSKKQTIDFKLPIENATEVEALKVHLQGKLNSLNQIVTDSFMFRVTKITHNEVDVKLTFRLAPKSTIKKGELKSLILTEVLSFKKGS